MPTFWYQTPDHPHRQHVTAPSLTAALIDLPKSVTAAGPAGPSPHETGAVRWGRLIPIYDQLGNLLAKGTPLVKALDLLARRTGHRRLRYSLQRLSDDISDGRSLSEAMALQPQIYSSYAVNMIAAGEAAGDLPALLADLAVQQRDLQFTTRRLLPLIVYPLFILTIIFLDLTFLVTFILPKFIQLFKELGMTDDKFPTTTLVLMRLHHVVGPFFGVLLLVLVLLYLLRTFRGDLLRGHLAFERGRLDLPFFGPLAMSLSLSNAASALSLLLRRNVDSAQAVRLAGAAAGNGVIEATFRRAAADIREGRSLVEALQARHLLPEEFVTHVGAAEAAADLPGALGRLAGDYRQRVNQAAATYPFILGPILIIALGFVLLFVALGMFTPLLRIIGELSS